jgi:hypothetical protein
MTLRRLYAVGLVLVATGLLTGCYYPAPPGYAYNAACAPGAAPPTINPDGTAAPAPTCYAYPPPPSYAYYPPYPYAYYPPYYAYPPVSVGVGFGFGFRGRFR